MNTPCFTAGLLSRHDAEPEVFYDPCLLQGLLFRGGIAATADWGMRDGVRRDGENLYYKVEPADFPRGAVIFTAHSGRYYSVLY